MKLVFFDMEFANGKIPGSVYSLGYVRTNEKFRLLDPQTDILMNPECSWNDYVRQKILAYPMRLVQQASAFPAYYKRIRKLLCRADLVVGYAVSNDTTALRKDCERYGLKPPSFTCLDLERVCKKLPDHREARGLDGCVTAWCNTVPENRHRSDGDAYATMLLFRAICEAKGFRPKEFAKRFSDCMIPSIPPKTDEVDATGKEKKNGSPAEHPENGIAAGQAPGTGNRKRRRRRSHAKPQTGTGSDAASAPRTESAPANGQASVRTGNRRRRRNRNRNRTSPPVQPSQPTTAVSRTPARERDKEHA